MFVFVHAHQILFSSQPHASKLCGNRKSPPLKLYTLNRARCLRKEQAPLALTTPRFFSFFQKMYLENSQKRRTASSLRKKNQVCTHCPIWSSFQAVFLSTLLSSSLSSPLHARFSAQHINTSTIARISVVLVVICRVEGSWAWKVLSVRLLRSDTEAALGREGGWSRERR